MTIRVNPVLNVDIKKINELINNAKPRAMRKDSVINPLPRDRVGNHWRLWDASIVTPRPVLD